MRRLAIISWGSALVVLLVTLASRAPSLPGRGDDQSLEVFGDAPKFSLVDHLNRPVSSEDFRGRVVVANFIYTSCTDVCPLLSAQMQSLQDRLRNERLPASQVQLLSFTVDPERDTPQVLRAYAERWQADSSAWRFLTGREQDVVPLIVQGFRLGVDALPPTVESASGPSHDEGTHAPGYEVMHSGRFVLIDRQSRIRAYYDGREFDADRILRDIHNLPR
ncbi:MAG: SCO family protein [Chloroflexi bacterium]|nr:SCO family protein [Chloroflexota bacterium]